MVIRITDGFLAWREHLRRSTRYCSSYLNNLIFLRLAGRLLAAGLLWEKDGVDVWEHTAGGDGDAAHELVELLVVPDGELEVPRGDPGLLVVAGSVAGELEDLGSEVLEDGGQVDWGAGSDALGEGSLLQVPVDPADRELESRARRPRLGFAFGFASFTSSRHV